MPALSSYLFQILDFGCSAPLKCAYSCLVESKMRLGFNHIDKSKTNDVKAPDFRAYSIPANLLRGWLRLSLGISNI
ncbi:hypothetical protein BDW75DRAFT_224722 [Aspergillus navahoensis]